MMDLELHGKRAVITGGSIGIGLAVAHALAAEGVDVAICARDRQRVEAAAEDIAQRHSVKSLGISADMSKAADIDAACARIAQAFDGIDILINNAGTGSSETILEAPDEKWQYYWDLHVMAAVRMSRALVPLMQRRGGGVILNTASICARQPLGYEPIYNTTKAALVMLSKCLANELIGRNIRVNAVNPGLILTPDWRKTAALLTQGTATTVDEYLGENREGQRPHRPVRFTRGAGPCLRLPLLAAGRLLRRIQLLRRRGVAEDYGVRPGTSGRLELPARASSQGIVLTRQPAIGCSP